MTIKEFVNEFNKQVTIERKISWVKKHVTTKYVPYSKKMAICQNVVQYSSYSVDPITSREIFNPNTNNEYMLYIMALIEEYTDLRFYIAEGELKNGSDNDLGKSRLDEFELLDQYGVLDYLFDPEGDIIPADEIRKFNSIMQKTKDDVIAKEESLVRFWNNKFDSVIAFVNLLGDQILERIKAELNMQELGSDDIIAFMKDLTKSGVK